MKGDAEKPDAQCLARAQNVLEHLDHLTQRALQLLGEFIKDKGTWSLAGVGCGTEADRQRCDFLLSFGFEAEGDPVRLVSELDDERFERRKLEFFSDGTIGAASDQFEGAHTRLGVAAVPSLCEINEDSQFEGVQITQAKFESLWKRVRLETR